MTEMQASNMKESIDIFQIRKNGPSMIKTTINCTKLALKMLRKNVNIPLPYDNGCMCLHPKEQSRSGLSNDSDHSLIPLQICTRDNKRYVIKWIRFICKNMYILFQRR